MDENTPSSQDASNGSEQPPEAPVSLRPNLLQRLRNYFLTGIVVAAPIAITIYLAWLFINSIDNLIRPLIPEKYSPETYLPFGIPGFGVIVVVAGLTLLGALTANFLGRYLLGIGERIVNRMPVIRSVYGTLKQIFETVVSQSSTSFQEVVLVEYPRPGLWALAFVTTETRGEVRRVLDQDLVSVFLPTTPNPTSGFLLFVPRKDLIRLDMTVEEGVKKVISAGIVTPSDRHAAIAKKLTPPSQPERK